ncbi:DUF1080 domain-containing protein [Algoriphagus halophytocola]|uniref:DUF1080 domain-containing protein n=1 Tax=Algoriphagus halophytocola TaxID=2991499 RepID=A0ABY6MGC8_9BACT|nr:MULTISPECIES: DUF1080 domain-containing protein [unclassified Algoriphagus]UZD22243.1 DUF1080 domain-containing protein [Algoriphagus sp. TR-M5]WBL43491.1 DUF1080 domain-containing protein [Algoriphagus sp. TR-M9]
MKKQFLAAVILAASLGACSSEKALEQVTEELESEASSAENKEDWINLFEGKNFDHWHKYGGKEVGNAWKIDDEGVVYLDAENKDQWGEGDGGDLVTNDEYENFHFKYDWKISENGNSGVIFLVHESPEYQQTYYTGMEMQIVDNDGHPDAKNISHRAGDLYDLIVSSEETAKPWGEWNQAEIIVNDGELEMKLNGSTLVKTTLWTPEWEALIADSKFKDMPGFGTFKKGRIALQDHGDLVHFKNVMIQKL